MTRARLRRSRRLVFTLSVVLAVCLMPAAALFAPPPVALGQAGVNCGTVDPTATSTQTPAPTNTPANRIFVEFSQREYFAQEPASGSQPVNVPVLLNKAPGTSNSVTVQFTVGVVGDTAINGVDYTFPVGGPPAATGSIVITGTNTSGLINLEIHSDGLVEGPEFFTLTITNVLSTDLGNPAEIKPGGNNPARITILDEDVGGPTITPSPTATGTNTQIPTATLSPIDGCEPNNSPGEATLFSVGANFTGMTLAPAGDVDWFRIQVKNGHAYEAETTVATGLDTVLTVFSDAGQTQVAQNDDKNINDLGSKVNFIANKDGDYYIRVTNKDPSDPTGKAYSLSVTQIVSLGSCVASSSPLADQCEPNNSPDQATAVVVGIPYPNLTLAPTGDVDWFRVVVKADTIYQADITIQDAGLDTFMELYRDPNAGPVATNDDKAVGDPASRLTFTAALDGVYWLKVSRKENGIDPAGKKYTLTVTATGTGPDAYEPNYDFNTATLINAISPGASGVEGNGIYSANFYPWHEGEVDNDFYKLHVKAGFVYDCRTSNLSQGTDTNLIAYDAAFRALGGNDDIAPNNLGSAFSYTALSDTTIYFVIGHNGVVPPAQAAGRTYQFSCEASFYFTPTPSATRTAAAGAGAGPITIIITTTPPPTTPTPAATGTPEPAIGIRPLTTPAPGSAAGVAQLVVVDLLIYYDANGNNVPNAGEGVAGLSAELHELATGRLIGQGFTDASGLLRLTATTSGRVQLLVPFIGFAQTVAGAAETIIVRIESRPLPERIP